FGNLGADLARSRSGQIDHSTRDRRTFSGANSGHNRIMAEKRRLAAVFGPGKGNPVLSQIWNAPGGNRGAVGNFLLHRTQTYPEHTGKSRGVENPVRIGKIRRGTRSLASLSRVIGPSRNIWPSLAGPKGKRNNLSLSYFNNSAASMARKHHEAWCFPGIRGALARPTCRIPTSGYLDLSRNSTIYGFPGADGPDPGDSQISQYK